MVDMNNDTATVHFRMYGEDLTRIARDILLSDQPTKAWRLLGEGLLSENRGESEYAARQILDGTMRLTGDEKGMGLEADNDSAKYREQVKYIYAGRVKIGPTWMRPRARIDCLEERDAIFAKSALDAVLPDDDATPGKTRAAIREFSRRRGQYYAREGERAFHVESRGQSLLVIFEPVSEPPFWWREQNDPAIALEEFLGVGRTLSREGSETRSQSRKPRPATRKRASPVTQQSKEARDAEEQRWAAEDAAYKEQLASYRARIFEQAGDNVFELRDKDGNVLAARVPRAPFENWALRRTSLEHLVPPWTPVCPSGLKVPMDDPYHSDWYLGAVGDLDGVYDPGPLHAAAMHECMRLGERLGRFECVVITDAGCDRLIGVVGETIVVLPDLHPDRLEKVINSLGVITEAGGQLAHLAQVAMERHIPIMLVPDATRILRKGMKVTMYPKDGRIRIH